MKICIPTAKWKNDGGQVAEHFGHSEWFVIFDTATGERVLAANRVSRDSPGGCRAVRQVGELGVDALVCRKIGRKAAATLGKIGISLYAAPGLTVEAVEAVASAGELEPLLVDQQCSGEPTHGGTHQHRHGSSDCSHGDGGSCH